jgi:sporulation protein YlmC with PRC-barrel domain
MNTVAPHARIGLAHHLLDHQLVDSRGERCGKVDDLALSVDDHGTLLVDAVLSGPGSIRRRARRPFTRWLFGLAGDREVAVHWRDVADIVDHVTLARPAPDLGLSRGEQHAAEVVSRVLGANAHAARLGPDRVTDPPPLGDEVLRLSGLLGTRVVDATGRELGRVREVRACKDGPLLSAAAGTAWRIVGLSLDLRGTIDRLGLPGRDHGQGALDASRVVDWRADPIVLRPD